MKSTGKAREVVITGETSSSSKLIEILETSAIMQNAAPRGTVTRGSQPGSERFMIAAEAKARPRPEPRPFMEVVTAMAMPVAPPPPPPNVAVMPAAPAAPDAAKATPAKPPAPGAKPPGK